MCLSVVAKIIEFIDQTQAKVDINGVTKIITISLLKNELELNDWVLIHTGFAIAKIDESKAMEIINAYDKIDNL